MISMPGLPTCSSQDNYSNRWRRVQLYEVGICDDDDDDGDDLDDDLNDDGDDDCN